MGFLQQIYCDSCSGIAPGASRLRETSEKTAKECGWSIAEKHHCPRCVIITIERRSHTESRLRHSKEADEDHQPEEVAKLISNWSKSWSELNVPNAPFVRVFRLWPEHVAGLVQEMEIPTTIVEIIETVGKKFGGGNYQICVVAAGTALATSLFQIAGEPRIMK